jgi:AcrR family transcriptional regulator
MDRRVATSDRIIRCALLMADERGFDGFTINEPATAADVTRRTLFNYFPSKAEAVLGAFPAPNGAALKVFRAGGPTGDLLRQIRPTRDSRGQIKLLGMNVGVWPSREPSSRSRFQHYPGIL